MRIAVASEGKDLDSLVSNVSGRAPYYLVVEDNKIVQTIKNPFAVGGGGAGLGVAKMLKNQNIGIVISQKFGPKMISALNDYGIKQKEVDEISVKDSLKVIE